MFFNGLAFNYIYSILYICCKVIKVIYKYTSEQDLLYYMNTYIWVYNKILLLYRRYSKPYLYIILIHIYIMKINMHIKLIEVALKYFIYYIQNIYCT